MREGQQEQRRRRRLEARDAQVEPARRPVHPHAEREDDGDEHDGDGVEDPLEAAVDLVVDHGRNDGQDDAEDQGHQLLAHEVQWEPVTSWRVAK